MRTISTAATISKLLRRIIVGSVDLRPSPQFLDISRIAIPTPYMVVARYTRLGKEIRSDEEVPV